MKPLSKRQQQILDFIKSEVLTKGYPPAVREICKEVGLQSSSTVHGHLTRLEKRGLIRRDPTKPRAIEVLDESGKQVRKQTAALAFLDLEANQPTKVISVPIIGKVTAGEPITAVENVDDYFPIPDNMAHGSGTVFMLEVSGDSMIEAGIFDGDMVIVKQQQSANNGDIVIAMTDEHEATCKRFYKENGHFRLQPENAALEPIILEQVSILGKVVGLYRDQIH